MKAKWKSWVELIIGVAGEVACAWLIVQALLEPWEMATLLWVVVGLLGSTLYIRLTTRAWAEV